MRTNKGAQNKEKISSKSQKITKYVDVLDEHDVVMWASMFEDLVNIRITLIDLNNEILYTTENSHEVIGYSFDDFQLLTTYGYIHPDDRGMVAENFSKFKPDGYSTPILYRIFKPSGEMRWIRGISQKFIESDTKKQIGILIVEFDITEEMIPVIAISEDRDFEIMINVIKIPVLFMKNNQIFWTSQNWQKFFEYKHNEVKNKQLDFLFKNQDEYAKFLLACNRDLKSKGEISYHGLLKTKSNNDVSVKIQGNAIDRSNLSKGILLFFRRDVQESTDASVNAIDFFKSIMNNSESLILSVVEQKITWINKSVEQILQYSNEELAGEDIGVLFQTKDAAKELISEMNKIFITRKNYAGEITCIRKDRMPLPFSVQISPISYEEKAGFILVLDPVSDLRQLVNTLREEKGELEFYSDLLFHDVLNLCQDALSQIDLSLLKVESNPTDSIIKQRKSRIEILRIAELIANMDKFFRIKRKGYELSTFDISVALEKAMESIQDKFEPRKITINHNIKPKRYFTLGNELLRDAFFNILDNAVMFDRNDEVIIDIYITTSEDFDGYWRIEFIDNGPGIGEEMKKYLFDRYARSKGTIHGSGFGLTLVKEIIESFNGYVSVVDREVTSQTKGSIIIIDIPKLIS
ncbi:MAG: PAS domain-containing protein [Asgard group archaeon]|nr:PAS domain-containing protein [Asgard group archaeon]